MAASAIVCSCLAAFPDRQSLVDHLAVSRGDEPHMVNLRTRGRYQCPVCLRFGTGPEPHMQHLTSPSHRKTCFKYLHSVVPAADGVIPARPLFAGGGGGNDMVHFCQICDLRFKDLAEFHAHVDEKNEEHMVNLVRRNDIMARMVCEVCNRKLISGPQNYAEHMRSFGHRMKMETTEWQDYAKNLPPQPVGEEDASSSSVYFTAESSVPMSSASEIAPSSPDLSLIDDEVGSLTSEMTVCATALSSEEPSDDETSFVIIPNESSATGAEHDEATISSDDESDVATSDDEDLHVPYAYGRGLMLILNQELSGKGERHRKGSDKDVERLQKTFGQFNYDIEKHRDLSLSEIYSLFHKTTDRLNQQPNRYSSLMVFILSHGRKGDEIETTDEDGWFPVRQLPNIFSNSRCPALRGKPRLLFVVACRGENVNEAVAIKRVRTKRRAQEQIFEGDEVCADGVADKPIFRGIGDHSDFVLCFSTTMDSNSYRNTKKGTFYVRTLCRMIEKHHNEMDLMCILQAVRSRLRRSLRRHNNILVTQLSVEETGLDRPFWFRKSFSTHANRED